MKKLSIAIIAVASFGMLLAQQNYNMNTVNQLAQDVKTEGLLVVETALDEVARKESLKFQQLENKCKTDWSSIIDNFEAIEGGEDTQKLVVSTFQILEVSDYMSAIEKLAIRFENEAMTKPVIVEILNPTGRMRAFLADNHAHQRVIAALNKIKNKADAELIADIDKILSGEIKTGFEEIREDFAGTGYGNIPKLLLP